MMRTILPLTALVLSLSAGVASADRYRGESRGPVVVREHRGGGPVTPVVERRGGGRWDGGWRDRRVYVEPRYRHVDRRPIYVERPVIRERYYNYYRRPAVIVENYNPMAGYYWVAGQWSWTGYEWTWQPGHYEPDARYVEPSYDASYDAGY